MQARAKAPKLGLCPLLSTECKRRLLLPHPLQRRIRLYAEFSGKNALVQPQDNPDPQICCACSVSVLRGLGECRLTCRERLLQLQRPEKPRAWRFPFLSLRLQRRTISLRGSPRMDRTCLAR